MNPVAALFYRLLPRPTPVAGETLELDEHIFLTSDEKDFFVVIAASPSLAERLAADFHTGKPIRLRPGYRHGRTEAEFTHWRLTLNGGLVWCSIGATLEDALSFASAHIALPKGVSLAAVTQSVERLPGPPRAADWPSKFRSSTSSVARVTVPPMPDTCVIAAISPLSPG